MQGEFLYTKPRKYVMAKKGDSCYKEAPGMSRMPSSYLKEGSSEISDADYVGYANLPYQIHRKQMRRGFEFTMMILGEAGLGKSTFIDNLFYTDIYGPDYMGPTQRRKKTVEVERTHVLLEENGIKLYLTVVDVPGFGESLNNSGCWLPVAKYIDNRHQEYLDSQNRFYRNFIIDNRVHCCIYFISPWGYGLKPLDIQVLKNLHERVNIVPVIAKADVLTSEECVKFKEAVMKQLQENEIKIYDFPLYGSGDEINLNNLIPFAIIGSMKMLDAEGKKGRGRKYPWGNAEVENVNHCDFVALRNLLIRSHMPSLRDETNYRYENYRFKKMTEEQEYAGKLEEEKRVHQVKLKQLAEEMESVFERKIGEKLQKLKESEAELETRSQQMAESLEQERKDLEEQRAAFEKAKAAKGGNE